MFDAQSFSTTMKVQNIKLEMSKMNGHCNGELPSLNLDEEDTFHIHDIKKEPEDMSENLRKRKLVDSNAQNDSTNAAKRIKEEHLYIKTEENIPEIEDNIHSAQNILSDSASVIKAEKIEHKEEKKFISQFHQNQD